MSTSVKADAVRRCREAFHSNRIPWDDALSYLPVHKLNETAAYWERRYAEALEESGYELRTLRALISGLSTLNHGTGGGYLTPRQQLSKRHLS